MAKKKTKKKKKSPEKLDRRGGYAPEKTHGGVCTQA